MANTASAALAVLEDKASQLDAAANEFSHAIEVSKTQTPFSSAILLARGVDTMKKLLDDSIMREIMLLADSQLGFVTDRGGKPDDQRYTTPVIREVIIEACLRGYYPVGNEFNVIAGKFYAAKNGLHRKVVSYPLLTDFKEFLGIPKRVGEGAIVTAKATWRLDGTKCELEREFAIRVNQNMGTDAILGKCQRKLYAAVLHRLSGVMTPEGDIDDPPLAPGTIENHRSAAAKPVFDAPAATANQAPAASITNQGTSVKHWQDLKKQFSELGITPDQLLNRLELESEEEVTLASCDEFLEILAAIYGNQSPLEVEFPKEEQAKSAASIPKRAEDQADFLSGVGDPKEPHKKGGPFPENPHKK